MAAWCYVVFTLMVFVAISFSAPTNDIIKILKMPKECQGERYCSIKPKGYDKLVESMQAALPPFLTEKYNSRSGGVIDHDSDLPLGLSPESDWHNCPYRVQKESMYLFRDKSNPAQIDIIVQTHLFSQNITTVKCAFDKIPPTQIKEEACYQGLGLKTFSVMTTCHEIFANRSLFVFDFETKKTYEKSYEVPVSCSCKTSKDF